MQAACKQSLNFCLYSALHSRAQRECETVSSKPNRPEDLARRVAARRSAETAGRHAATGQWRRETTDAIYAQPFIPLSGTAGRGGRWTGAYAHLRADYAFNPSLTGTIEAVHYEAGATLRASGRDDSDYLGVELKYGW